MKILLFLLIYILKAYTSSASGLNIIKPEDVTDLELSVICAACHDRIYSEWSGSMHAKAQPSKNQLVDAFYKYLARKEVPTDGCNKCHSPYQSMYPKELHQRSEIFNEGINCAFCHSIYEEIPEAGQRRGIDFYHIDFLSGYAGPTDAQHTRFHDTRHKPIFRTVRFCAGCHQEGETDPDHANNGEILCQECHMPPLKNEKSASFSEEREVVYRHLFEGGHSGTMLGSAARISGEAIRKKGDVKLKLNIENKASHPVPVGFPLREAYIKVEGLNKDEKVVWSNFRKDPLKEDPQGHFSLAFSGDNDMFAHYVREIKPIKDRRLKPGENRELKYNLKSSSRITDFRVTLYYRLISRSAIRKLNVPESLAKESIMVREIIPIKIED